MEDRVGYQGESDPPRAMMFERLTRALVGPKLVERPQLKNRTWHVYDTLGNTLSRHTKREDAERALARAQVRALLAELRAHGMSDEVVAAMKATGTDVGDCLTIWEETLDAILAGADA